MTVRDKSELAHFSSALPLAPIDDHPKGEKSSEFRRRDVVSGFRPIGRLKPTFDWTGEKQLDQALISRPLGAFQKILALIKALNFEFLAGVNSVLLPDCGRQDDLSFAGNGSLHGGKILTYLSSVKFNHA